MTGTATTAGYPPAKAGKSRNLGNGYVIPQPTGYRGSAEGGSLLALGDLRRSVANAPRIAAQAAFMSIRVLRQSGHWSGVPNPARDTQW